MSRQCDCGGTLTIHQLTGDREAWRCLQCNRYDVKQWGLPIGVNPHTIGTVTVLDPLETTLEPLALCSEPVHRETVGPALGTQSQGLFAF